MTNPAQKLHDLLTSWYPVTDEMVAGRRGTADLNDLEFWKAHRAAIDLLHEIEVYLAGMSQSTNMTPYFEILPNWYNAVFAPRYDWLHRATKASVSEHDIRSLQMLASQMELLSVQTELAAADVGELLAALEKAHRLAARVKGLSDPERRFVIGLIAQARQALEEIDVFGSASARRVLLELNGSLVRVAASEPNDDRQRKIWSVIKTIAGKIGYKAVDKMIEIGADEVMVQVDQIREITS